MAKSPCQGARSVDVGGCALPGLSKEVLEEGKEAEEEEEEEQEAKKKKEPLSTIFS